MKVYKNFDANASHGTLPEITEALKEFDLDFLNPSAIHQLGQKAKAIVEEARYEISALMQLGEDQRIVFTSGASEANNQAIFHAAAQANFSALSSAIEHPSVLEALNILPNVELLSPNKNLEYTKEQIINSLSDSTSFISLMFANNETGYILPIAEIFSEIKKLRPDILLHTDAVQVLGKLPVNFSELTADFISVSAHKIGGLSGVGALIINDNLSTKPLIYGGPQEHRYRAGTENVLGIYAFGLAAKASRQKQEESIKQTTKLRNTFEENIKKAFPEIRINCQDKDRLPNTSSICIPNIIADDLVVAMDLQGVAISSGAACASGKPLPSHVLLAMGISEEEARSTIRVSFRSDVSKEDIILLEKKLRTALET